ncbi:MAG: hypothetical protein ACRCZF_10060, partial [Gemmataceae bacterium]
RPSESFSEKPNIELIRRNGWTILNSYGAYCVVCRGAEQIVFQWSAGEWVRVHGRGPSRLAA